MKSVRSTRYLNETATYFSSGGFSDYWKRPSYQDDDFKAHFHTLGEKNKSYFKSHGRGFPVVSAPSYVHDKSVLKRYQGTSCSASASRGIVALLNDERLKAKKPSLGFSNPPLYTNPDALNDIVLGGSTGCDGTARFHGAPNGRPSSHMPAGTRLQDGILSPNLCSEPLQELERLLVAVIGTCK